MYRAYNAAEDEAFPEIVCPVTKVQTKVFPIHQTKVHSAFT